MQEQRRRPMRNTVGVHAFQETKVVDVPGNVREEFGNVLAAITVLFEFPGRLKNTMLADLSGLGQGAGIVKLPQLTVVPGKQCFVIKRVDVTWPALHENEDHTLGSWDKVRLGGGEWISDRGNGLLVRECGRGQVTKTAAERLECRSSTHGDEICWSHDRH